MEIPTIKLQGKVKSARADIGKGRMAITIDVPLHEETLELRMPLMFLVLDETHVTCTIERWQPTLPGIDEAIEDAVNEAIPGIDASVEIVEEQEDYYGAYTFGEEE